MRQISSWPRSVAAVLALFLVLFGWAVSSPPGASPDDDYHLASSYCSLGNRSGLCEPGDEERSRRIPTGLLSLQNCYSTQSVSAACLEKNLEILSGSMSNSSRLNTDNFYPKLFYWSNGLFVSNDIESSVMKTRIFNIAIVISLFCLAFLFSDPGIRLIIPITVTVCSVPLGLFIFASNNPSSWSISSIVCYAFLLASLKFPLLSRENLKLLLPLTICVVVALGSRSDSAFFLTIVTIGVYLFVLDEKRVGLRDLFLLTSVASIAPIFYLITNAHTQKFVANGFMEGAHSIAGLDIFMFNIQSIPQLLLGGFGFSFSEIHTRTGHLGWFNSPVPPTTSIIVFSIFLILISNSFGGWTRASKRAVSFFAFIFILLAMFVHQRDKTLIGQEVQPRYFLVFVFLILGFALVQHHPRLSVGTRSALVASLGIAQSLALYLVIKRYSVGYGDFGLSLNSGIQWWGFDAFKPNTVWLMSSVAFAYLAYWSTGITFCEPKRISQDNSD